MQEISLNQTLNNNSTYQIYFKNLDHMVLEKYQVMPFIRMYFDRFIKNNQLNIVNYFLDYDEQNNYHILIFDTLDNVDHISLKQIVDYIITESNKNSNINLKYMQSFIVDETAEKHKQDNLNNNMFTDSLDRVDKIMYAAAALYILSIIKDLTDN